MARIRNAGTDVVNAKAGKVSVHASFHNVDLATLGAAFSEQIFLLS